MSTTNRIVLLDRAGEELFSGESLLSEPPPPPTDPLAVDAAPPPPAARARHDDEDGDEPIPATLRSSILLRAHEPVSRPIIVEVADVDHRAA